MLIIRVIINHLIFRINYRKVMSLKFLKRCNEVCLNFITENYHLYFVYFKHLVTIISEFLSQFQRIILIIGFSDHCLD